MDCIEVQQLLSQAIDGEPISREQMAEARAHCTACVTCAAFVQGLARVHRTPPPAEPAGLADRVTAAVQDEARRADEAASAERTRTAASADQEAAAAAALAADTSMEADAGEPGVEPAPLPADRRPAPVVRRRMSPVAIGAWIGAAAAVLIVASYVTIAGVRSITQGPNNPTLASRETAGASKTTPSTADQSAQTPSASQTGTATGAAETAGAAKAVTSPNMIAVEGFAYRLAGITPLDRSELTTFTTTTTSLDSETAPQTYTVYRTPTGGRVALVRGEEMLLFDIARRTFDGRAYALTTGPLSSFEIWPALPASIPEPTTPQGAPTLLAAGLDATGTEVYKLPTTPASKGIAVPPGTPQSDPSGGDPEWTWWTSPPP